MLQHNRYSCDLSVYKDRGRKQRHQQRRSIGQFIPAVLSAVYSGLFGSPAKYYYAVYITDVKGSGFDPMARGSVVQMPVVAELSFGNKLTF